MPADRGTLPRGPQPLATDTSTRPQPTPPNGRRPPGPRRERKPGLAAVALILIVGGALAAAYLVVQNNHRVAAVEVSQQIGAGQRIPLTAIREVQIAPGSGLAYVPWNQAPQVTRYFAATTIPAGTLLAPRMVAPAANLARGRSVLGLALKDGELPNGLAIGDHVDLYQVSDSPHACPGASGSTLSANAIVLGISNPPAVVNNSAIDVRVATSPADAGAVACNAANGNVGIAVLPFRGAGPGSGGAATVPSAPVPSSGGQTGGGGAPSAPPSPSPGASR